MMNSVDLSSVRVGSLAVIFLASCGIPEVTPSHPPIRVGTTGTTPPFSRQVEDDLVGIDIDLAQNFGAWQGRPVEFVLVSWPELLTDLENGRFDLAMSGIYMTHERERVGLFSQPYLYVGQRALARCEDVERFRTLSDVNQSRATVLATRGGANPDFIERILPGVTVATVDPDPREIADRVARGEGDVAFGTSLGVEFFAAHDSRLCVALEGNSVNEDLAIAVLMTHRSQLQSDVNRWIMSRRHDGFIDSVVERHRAMD